MLNKYLQSDKMVKKFVEKLHGKTDETRHIAAYRKMDSSWYLYDDDHVKKEKRGVFFVKLQLSLFMQERQLYFNITGEQS